MDGRTPGYCAVHLYQSSQHTKQVFQVPKMPGREGGGWWGRVSRGGAGAAGSRGHQSESGPSLFSIGFLWREVDCPFLAFRWLLGDKAGRGDISKWEAGAPCPRCRLREISVKMAAASYRHVG